MDGPWELRCVGALDRDPAAAGRAASGHRRPWAHPADLAAGRARGGAAGRTLRPDRPAGLGLPLRGLRHGPGRGPGPRHPGRRRRRRCRARRRCRPRRACWCRLGTMRRCARPSAASCRSPGWPTASGPVPWWHAQGCRVGRIPRHGWSTFCWPLASERGLRRRLAGLARSQTGGRAILRRCKGSPAGGPGAGHSTSSTLGRGTVPTSAR